MTTPSAAPPARLPDAAIDPPPPLAGVAPPAPGCERSRLFRFTDGDRLEDAGVIAVAAGPFARTEHFEVVRRADGGRTVTSVIAGAGGSYRVEGRWTYGADETAQAAEGLADYGGTPVHVAIRVADTVATIAVDRDGAAHRVAAPCHSCLIDLSPSALPMFSMTRRYDAAHGGVQGFAWIGRGLVQDRVLTEGHAAVRTLGRGEVPGPDGATVAVDQYHFVETITDSDTGRALRIAFNLYVDETHRPLGFVVAAMGSLATGVRVGYDDLVQRLPPVFDPDEVPGGP